MDEAIKPIAVIQGASGPAIQRLFRDFADRWKSSHRIVGMIEEPRGEGDLACGPGRLLSIVDGKSYALFQELGTGAAGCSLDPTAIISACGAVEADIAGGCDLALLSKFGKLEGENRSGLVSAFSAAIEAGVPILTSVSPRCEAAWTRFAAPLFVSLPAEEQAIERWWQAICSARPDKR
jgi:hypothetical protein